MIRLGRSHLLIAVVLYFYAGRWVPVMLNTCLPRVWIDWETGPPLDRLNQESHLSKIKLEVEEKK